MLPISGCAVLGVPEQRQTVQRFARIPGEVRVDIPNPHPIVVVLLRRSETRIDFDPEAETVAETVTDHFPLAPGERREDFQPVIPHDGSLDRHHDIRELQALASRGISSTSAWDAPRREAIDAARSILPRDEDYVSMVPSADVTDRLASLPSQRFGERSRRRGLP